MRSAGEGGNAKRGEMQRMVERQERVVRLAEAQAAKQAAASASSAAASAGPKPLPSVVLRGTAGKAPSQKKGASAAQQRSDDGNMFSVLVSASDAAAGPSTPRKVQASSLSLLSCPTRSFSTPDASAAPRPSGRSSKKKLTGALDASSVAAAAGDGRPPFQQQKGRKRRKADVSPQQEEEKESAKEKAEEQQQPPRRQPLPSPQQQQPSASEPMDH